MSYIMTRTKGDIFQLYCNPDIYGIGKWVTEGQAGLFDLPRLFGSRSEAKCRQSVEMASDPDWEYEISFYDR